LKRLLKETLPSPKLSQFLFEFIAANERKLQLDSNTTNTSITEMEDSLSQQDVDASQADPSGSSDAAAAMLRFVWNDYIVGILQLVLDAKPLLGNHLPRLLVQLDKQAAPLASSLPFSALILGLITKYPDMVRPEFSPMLVRFLDIISCWCAGEPSQGVCGADRQQEHLVPQAKHPYQARQALASWPH
jgi:hypothetical protein